jgi:hypothetical protein
VATIAQYLDLAEGVHGDFQSTKSFDECRLPRGFKCQKWEQGSLIGNGLQGGIFTKKGVEVIVALKGTQGGPGGSFSLDGSKRTTALADISADVRLALGIIPNQASGAYKLVKIAMELGEGPVSIVGHSLGGALAQVAGNWTGRPFISFCGPGMKGQVKLSCFNFLKPMQMTRSIFSKSADDTVGICFGIRGDWIHNYGHHMGWEKVFDYPGHGGKHDLDTMRAALRAADYLDKTPRDIYSVWPAS